MKPRTILYPCAAPDRGITRQRAKAERAGLTIDKLISDEGPSDKALFNSFKPGDTLIVPWVQCLGRNYDELAEAVRALMNRGVLSRTVVGTLVFNGATANPIRKVVREAMISVMAALAEAQGEATKAAWAPGRAPRRYATSEAELFTSTTSCRRRHDRCSRWYN